MEANPEIIISRQIPPVRGESEPRQRPRSREPHLHPYTLPSPRPKGPIAPIPSG